MIKTSSYSQENEQEIIKDYFKDEIGALLSIGENDGQILSNTRQLILDGWSAMLIEPSKAYLRLAELYKDNYLVNYVQCCIGNVTGMVTFYESLQHISPNDAGLISTMLPDEIRKWKGSKFDNFFPTQVQCYTWNDFYRVFCENEMKFDFITIDTEGMDWSIVQQMDMDQLGCRLICVEHNSIPERKKEFEDYFSKFKFKLFGVTYHNLIFAR